MLPKLNDAALRSHGYGMKSVPCWHSVRQDNGMMKIHLKMSPAGEPLLLWEPELVPVREEDREKPWKYYFR